MAYKCFIESSVIDGHENSIWYRASEIQKLSNIHRELFYERNISWNDRLELDSDHIVLMENAQEMDDIPMKCGGKCLAGDLFLEIAIENSGHKDDNITYILPLVNDIWHLVNSWVFFFLDYDFFSLKMHDFSHNP